MIRALLGGLLMALLVGAGEASGPRAPSAKLALEAEPDPTQSRELQRWPNANDLRRLQSVEGQSKAVILQILGHPCRVERRPDGEEVWDYPWLAACRVWIRQGVCTGTFYTSGW
jgi:hypothetical protein